MSQQPVEKSEVVEYFLCEFLAADAVTDAESGVECIGISIVTEDDGQVDLAMSLADAKALWRQLRAAIRYQKQRGMRDE